MRLLVTLCTMKGGFRRVRFVFWAIRQWSIWNGIVEDWGAIGHSFMTKLYCSVTVGTVYNVDNYKGDYNVVDVPLRLSPMFKHCCKGLASIHDLVSRLWFPDTWWRRRSSAFVWVWFAPHFSLVQVRHVLRGRYPRIYRSTYCAGSREGRGGSRGKGTSSVKVRVCEASAYRSDLYFSSLVKE